MNPEDFQKLWIGGLSPNMNATDAKFCRKTHLYSMEFCVPLLPKGLIFHKGRPANPRIYICIGNGSYLNKSRSKVPLWPICGWH